MTAEAAGKQGHDGEQAEQAGRGASDGLVGPLPLGLDTEVVADFSEGDLQLPALREPAEDLQRLLRQVGAEQGLRVEAPAGVAQQHPADRHDWHAGVAPDGGIGADLHHALAFAVPVGHDHALPRRGWVGQHRGQGRQALALGARPTEGLELARRGRGVERSVEPQTGDAGHALLDKAGEELESGETAVRHEHLARQQPWPVSDT